MNSRVAVPKLFRRKDRWYVRVQVPKAMQKRLRKREYWISLKTSDRQEAIMLAPSVVAEKRTEMNMVYNRLEGIRQSISEFTEEQRQALFREAYADHVASGPDLMSDFEKSHFGTLVEFANHREATIEDLIDRLRISRGDYPAITVMMLKLAEANGISTPEGSKAEETLRSACVEGFIEAKRNEIALLRGRAVHSNPNPEMVDPDTGRPREFTPLRNILARPPEEPISLTRLVEDFISNPNKIRAQKTKDSIRGSMAVVIEILGDNTPPEDITEQDCERVRDLIMQLPPNFKKLPALRDRPVEEMVRIARSKGMSKLSPTGVNTYLKWLTSFLNWCQRKGKIARVPTSFSEICVADPERKEHKRLPFSDSQLQTYFHSRIFKGQERSNSVFWVSLIALWNGMRSNEICQLDVANVVQVEGT